MQSLQTTNNVILYSKQAILVDLEKDIEFPVKTNLNMVSHCN